MNIKNIYGLEEASFPDISLDTLIFLSDLHTICDTFQTTGAFPEDLITDEFLDKHPSSILYDTDDPCYPEFNENPYYPIDLNYAIYTEEDLTDRYPNIEAYYNKNRNEIDIWFFSSIDASLNNIPKKEPLIYLTIPQNGHWYVTHNWN